MADTRKKQRILFMADNEHIVYMLKCKDSTLYTGYTNDLDHRLHMHRSGKGAKYTRGRGPFQVVFIEKFPTKEEAMKREYQIKKRTRKEKFELIREKLKEVMQFEHTKKF